MRRALSLLFALLASPVFARPPRLTLFITVDALGTDVLMRSRPRLKGGLSSILNNGAFFPTARYEYAEAVTAAGHATLATGANPWRHGIVKNRIINRATGKLEPIFADPNHPVLEVPASDKDDASPENLLAETLSDRLRVATASRGKAIAISTKARAAITLGGRLGQAWWFNSSVGKFVTGTFYAKEFPGWVKAFNDKKLPDASFGKQWTLSLSPKDYLGDDDRPAEADAYGLGRTFPHLITGGLPAPGPQFYSAFSASPFMVDLLVQMAKAAIEGEQLGKDDIPDLLSVSFSPTDLVYHLYGPYSWEMQDMVARLDRAIGELISACEKAAGGRSNLLVVLTADHGGAALPEEWAAAGLPASRVSPDVLRQGLLKELQSRFGADLSVALEETDVYLLPKNGAEKKLDGPTVRRAAAQWLSRQPPVLLAIARDDLSSAVGGLAGFGRNLMVGYYPDRSGDVLFLPKPFVVLDPEPNGTSHGTPYAYDNQVPVAFMGHGIKSGVYPQLISPVDVAPTVATVMEIGIPASAEGSPRPEAAAGRSSSSSTQQASP